ncbi:hypothetical protein CTI12_AA108880 [Artemisia annua]|uniref:Uncharacterized protein n=1 Tax=Artemisia annua TaxID=35608 RepID=A0A2U1PV81_ARTAN|nr:hypothetical protein CTI12_AA108880 [Artemisia annua]
MESPIINSNSRRSSASNSPEFEFWITQPQLHQSTADQLFSGGVLLPLHHQNHPPDKKDDQDFTKNTVQTNPDEKDHKDDTFEPRNTQPINPTDPDENINGSDLKATPLTASKRWKDIFKKNPDQKDKEKNKKTKEKFSGTGSGAGPGTSGTAELNINLWPFSRSRSAGTSGSRPRTVAVGNRKVSSAPCSRSNSTGDKNRKWPSSPGRAGVHLGRSSPVWQGAKRFGQSRSLHDNLLRNSVEKVGPTRGGGVPTKSVGVKVVPKGMSCRSGVGVTGSVAGSIAAGVTPAGEGGGGGASSTSLFNLRTLFTKKVVF